jgi:spore coat polysaccharide biosynthesis predicted glycosyltransferase SpsG
MLIEDFNHCSKNPDILLNHSPGANSKMYPDHHCLIGPKYCLVNPIFNASKEPERTKGQVLLSFGGVDPLNLSLPSIKSLLLLSEEFQIILIAGTQERANQVRQQLSQKELEQVKILSNISSKKMAEFMATSEFGIFPSSTVAMEACQSKLPLIVTQTSDNQQLYRDGLLEKGLAIFIEPQQLSNEKSLSRSIEKLREQRTQLRSAQDFYFDGNSKGRIINEIRNLIESKK